MTSKINEALAKLDPNNDGHWTSDGLPRIDTVKMFASNPALTREDITKAAPDFNRETAKAAADKADQDAKAAQQAASGAQGTNGTSGEGSTANAQPGGPQAPQGTNAQIVDASGSQAKLSGEGDGTEVVKLGSNVNDNLQNSQGEQVGSNAAGLQAGENAIAGEEPINQNSDVQRPLDGASLLDETKVPLKAGDPNLSETDEAAIARLDQEIADAHATVVKAEAYRESLVAERDQILQNARTQGSSSHAEVVQGYQRAQEAERVAAAEKLQALKNLGLDPGTFNTL